MRELVTALLLWAALCSCAPQASRESSDAVATDARGATPVETFSGGASPIGEPLAVVVDFDGNPVVADGSPGRLLRWIRGSGTAQEFQLSNRRPGFFPTDVTLQGFFVYAVDEFSRTILRFDRSGAFRDVLLNFERLELGRRVSPYSIAVDETARLLVTDVENHQVLVFDAYLALELAFGNYGTYEGQLDRPEGVAFTTRGDIVVADTGNRRVQVFTTAGTFSRVVPAPGTGNPLRAPRRAVASRGGALYVADPRAGAVFVFTPSGELVDAIRPGGVSGFEPTDVAVTRSGELFVTDTASRSVLVFEVE